MQCPNCGPENRSDARFCGNLLDLQPALESGPYVPVRLSIDYAEAWPQGWTHLFNNRLLLLVKWLFAIPLYLWLVIYGIIAGVATFIAFWAILFTGRFPAGLFAFVRGYIQYQNKVYAYFPLLLANHWTPNESHPLRIEVDYPDSYSRPVLVFLKLPSFLLDVVFGLAEFALFILFLLAIPTWWIVLVTGRYPRGWFDLSPRMLEWQARVTAWQFLMRDDVTLFGTTTPVKVAVGIGIVGATILGIISWAYTS